MQLLWSPKVVFRPKVAPRQEHQSSGPDTQTHSSPPGSGGAEVYNWWDPKQVVSCAFHHLGCLVPVFGAAGTEFADRISQLLAKESTSAWPNWIEHTRDK